MLTLTQINDNILTPALQLLPVQMDSKPARIMLLAINLQEDPMQERIQRGMGPARGLWQFERGGGVRGVLSHDATEGMAEAICVARGVMAEEGAVWRNLQTDDILAACFARLLLWSDPKPLPTEANGGWGLYARVWRPGKPHPDRWNANYERAHETIMG